MFEPAHAGHGDKARPGCLALWSDPHMTHFLHWGWLALVQLCWGMKQCNFVCLLNSYRCSVSWMCFLLFLMNSWFLQKLLQDFRASNLICCSRSGNDILMIMANGTLIFTLLAASFLNELLMQAFFPPIDTHQHFPNPLWTITLSCHLASGLATGLINFNISSRTICVKKYCFNTITKNPAASSVTHHFKHVQIYCRVHYQIRVQWMVVWQLASFLPSFYCSFKDCKVNEFPASLAARVLDVNWVLPGGVLVNI